MVQNKIRNHTEWAKIKSEITQIGPKSNQISLRIVQNKIRYHTEWSKIKSDITQNGPK